MAKLMDHWKATWRSEEVVTDDGYHLIMFNITGFSDLGPIDVKYPPLLAIHAMMVNSEMWVNDNKKHNVLPLMLNFAARGYDIWLGAVRGDKYGQVHDTYAFD